MFILLALSAFGENASRRARTHARRDGSVGTASRAARRFGGDEAVARLRATAVTTVEKTTECGKEGGASIRKNALLSKVMGRNNRAPG